MITEYIPLHKLGVVRSHAEIEDFAGVMVRLNAITPETSVTVASVIKSSGYTRRSAYNKLHRPGFVTVNNGLGMPNTYYYLYQDGFGDLAKEQGHQYYPEHLGPLVGKNKIPCALSREFTGRSDQNLDVIGTLKIDTPDSEPLLVRAVGVNDALITGGTLPDEAGGLIIEVLRNPIGKDATLDNALVLLGGIKRWLLKYNDYDVEKQTYIKEQIK